MADLPPTRELDGTPAELAGSEKAGEGLTSSGLALGAGLWAVAEEIPRRPVAEAIRQMAAELDRGVSPDAVLGAASSDVPVYLRGLILGGLRTGRVAHVLEELLAMDQERVDLRRRILAAVAYATILIFLLFAVLVCANAFVVKPVSRIYDEWGVELPNLTRMIVSVMSWFDRIGLASMAIAFAVVILSFVVLLVVPKPPALQRVCYRLPVVGPVWRWQSLVDFSRMMHLLLDQQIPVDEALELTADSLRWSDLAAVSRRCAADVKKGMGLCESMARYREFPASLHPLIANGIQVQRPGEGFAAAADMYRRRTGVDRRLWGAILPVILLVLVAASVGILVVSMILPLLRINMGPLT